MIGLPLPRFDGYEDLLGLVGGVDWNAIPWAIGSDEGGKYAELFASLAVNADGNATRIRYSFLRGADVVACAWGLLQASGLSNDILQRIWFDRFRLANRRQGF
jgi:hypothetical protein